jgi:hypothetical protein
MKNRLLLTCIAFFVIISSCNKEKPLDKIIDESLAFSARQYTLMAEVMKDKPDLLPRTTDASGVLVTSNSGWWTSGFFPGSLWYLYEYSKDDKFKDAAIQITSRLKRRKIMPGLMIWDLCFTAASATASGLQAKRAIMKFCSPVQDLFPPVSTRTSGAFSRGGAGKDGNALS